MMNDMIDIIITEIYDLQGPENVLGFNKYLLSLCIIIKFGMLEEHTAFHAFTNA